VDDVIGVHDQLRAALVAQAAEGKSVWSFHPFRVVRNAEFWGQPVGTRIAAGLRRRTPREQEQGEHEAAMALHAGTLSDMDRWMLGDPHRPDIPAEEQARRLARARRVLASNDPELRRRWWAGEDV
jgi:hypothetical protein